MKLLFASTLFLLATIAFGCGGKKQVAEEVGDDISAPNLVEVNAFDQGLEIIWEPNRQRLRAGYNIYISQEPIVEEYGGVVLPESIEPFNSTPFPGDTNPDDSLEHFIAEGLENATKYYVHVRTVYSDRTLSKPSRELLAVPGPRGEIELAIRYKGDRDGYSVFDQKYVPADDLENDLYYFSSEGKDYLGSPSRLNGFLKTNNFAPLPFSGEYDEVADKVGPVEDKLYGDRVEVEDGDWVLMRDPEDRFVLIKVLGFAGEGEDRQVRLYYAVSTIAGELYF